PSTVPTRDGKSDGFLLDYWTDSFRNGGRITLGTSDEFSRNTHLKGNAFEALCQIVSPRDLPAILGDTRYPLVIFANMTGGVRECIQTIIQKKNPGNNSR
ncbi:MAG: hypothetical protein WA705_18625, partial [Candidatus Ozemobacteraceae bacterium]